MSTTPIEVTLPTHNIRVTVESGRTIQVSFPSASAGHLQATDIAWFVPPVESPDGSRTTFTLPGSETYRSGFLKVFRDGVMLDTGVTELTGRQTFQLDVAPDSDEKLSLFYIKDTSS